MTQQSWTIIRGNSPLIATAIHNGHEVRSELKGRYNISEKDRLREEDPFTGVWTKTADTKVILHRSRFEVDLNRPETKAVYIEPEDAWGLQVWKEKPSPEMIRKSLQFYSDFYSAMTDLLNETIDKWGRFVLLDLHTYCHRRKGEDADFDEIEKNPEVIVGTSNMDRSLWAPVVDGFISDLKNFNYMGRHLDVRENVKFRGGNFSQWIHRTFPGKGCALAIEFKKFFMDEWSGNPYPEQITEIGKALSRTKPGLLNNLKSVSL